MMADFAQAIVGQHTNEFYVRFVNGSGRVLERTLIRIAIIRLRMIHSPGSNLIFVNEDLAVFLPCVEFGQRFTVVVLTDSSYRTTTRSTSATSAYAGTIETKPGTELIYFRGVRSQAMATLYRHSLHAADEFFCIHFVNRTNHFTVILLPAINRWIQSENVQRG